MSKKLTYLLIMMVLCSPMFVIAQETAVVQSQSTSSTNVDLFTLGLKAEAEAQQDLNEGNIGWGLGAFAASLLLSPLLGGGVTIIAAYTVSGEVNVSPIRLAAVEKEFPGNSMALQYYATQYTKKYDELKKKGQAKAAWIGTGAGFVVNLVLLSAILAEE